MSFCRFSGRFPYSISVRDSRLTIDFLISLGFALNLISLTSVVFQGISDALLGIYGGE